MREGYVKLFLWEEIEETLVSQTLLIVLSD